MPSKRISSVEHQKATEKIGTRPCLVFIKDLLGTEIHNRPVKGN